MSEIIALCNQKGGVGKTTCTLNIAAGLEKMGEKVLLIDLDPQAHLTYSLGIPAHELNRTIYDLFKGTHGLPDVLLAVEGLAVVPSSLELSGLEMELAGVPGREFILRESLSRADGFTYIFIDCPPSLGILTLNALTAAREIYIPLQTEFLALKGMSKLIETIDTVKKRLNRDLEITGIIGTRYDARRKLNKGIVETIGERFGAKLFKTIIRENISLAEAPGYGQTIFSYAPKSYGAEDYLALAGEIIARKRPAPVPKAGRRRSS
ncbi:MAG TPA: ParA family protein [Syntrophales bacterium]|nr:ParA family protein [Syntrophales bacterium]HOH72951.1 ParA family protein [Syntrophales bacterium]HPX81193.1 ParA family protein [Syntrophales bacterium]HQK79355.1 ParA family protein [Syntrophales bacterium]